MPDGPRLIVLSTSDRLPGLLDAAGWRALSAGPVCAPRPRPEFDVPVRVLDSPTALRDTLDRHETVVWLNGPDDPDWPAQLAVAVEHVRAAAEPPGTALLDLVEVMDRLRRECPWDSQQSHASLRRFLLEEAYEANDALLDADPEALREELGDVLFQVFFHARLAQETPAGWGIDEVATDLAAKLIRRHPHVFAGLAVADADEVNANWDAIKRAEKRRESVFDGVPHSLPALLLAETLRRKAIRVGLPVDLAPEGVAVATSQRAEDELRAECERFRDRARRAERAARAAGLDQSTLDNDGWRRYWPR